MTDWMAAASLGWIVGFLWGWFFNALVRYAIRRKKEEK